MILWLRSVLSPIGPDHRWSQLGRRTRLLPQVLTKRLQDSAPQQRVWNLRMAKLMAGLLADPEKADIRAGRLSADSVEKLEIPATTNFALM